MDEVRLVAPNGNLGSGYLLSSLERALAAGVDAIVCDSGSTDIGPTYLGEGKPEFPRRLYVRDLTHILVAGHRRRIPVIIGSAAGAGADSGVDFLCDIVREVAAQNGFHFRLARIYSEQSKPYILGKLGDHKIKPLWPSGDLDSATVVRAERIVGMMGCEPVQAALDAEADVIIAGRSSDSALFAALPMLRGLAAGPAWHAAKILECGAAAAVHRLVPDCMMAAIREDHCVVWPPNPEMRCSTLSVAAHTLYENSDPYFLREPSGTLDTTHCRYEQVDDRAVRVSGSEFQLAPSYTIKVEAAESAGFSALAIAGIRDSFILNKLDRFLGEVRSRTEMKVMESVGLKPDEYMLNFRIYGRNGVMGAREPIKAIPHEVGVIFEAVAPSQDLANIIVSTAQYVALHNPVPEWGGMVSNLALPRSLTVIPVGPAYRFSMNHVVEPASPMEMFRTDFEVI